MNTQHEQLEAEATAIRARVQKSWKRHQALDRDCDKRLKTIDAALLRLKFHELLNVPGGVIVRTRQPIGDRNAVLNDLAGELVEVGRTLGVVDFGQTHGKWRYSLSELLPATERHLQGRILTFA